MDIRQVAKTKPMDTDAEPEATPATAAPSDAPTGFDALMALADKQLAQRYRDHGMAAFTGAPPAAAPLPTHAQTAGSMGSNCKPAAAPTPAPAKPAPSSPKQPLPGLIRTEPDAQMRTNGRRNIPRNALCPCKSGQKFKRCCGKELPRTRFSDLIRSEAR